MSKTRFTQIALASAVMAAASFATAQAAEETMSKSPAGKEKCYGVAKKGENGCASANGTHGCASMAKSDYDGMEFKDVTKGSCEIMKGSLKPFEGANPKMKG
jgi:uncharacterized membrane protein